MCRWPGHSEREPRTPGPDPKPSRALRDPPSSRLLCSKWLFHSLHNKIDPTHAHFLSLSTDYLLYARYWGWREMPCLALEEQLSRGRQTQYYQCSDRRAIYKKCYRSLLEFDLTWEFREGFQKKLTPKRKVPKRQMLYSYYYLSVYKGYNPDGGLHSVAA